MLRHPISPKNTNPQSSPSTSIRGSHARSTNNDDTSSTSSISSEEVLFDLDERAMFQLPRHLQHTMREIQTERLNRLHSQSERVVHVDTSRRLRRSHHRHQLQNQHQQKQQWLSNVVTRLQTLRPTVIPDGGFGALTSREKREVAPWVEEEEKEEQGITSREDKKSPEVVVGLDSEAESDSGLGSNSLGSVGRAPKQRHEHAAAPNTACACSPHLRRPRRRDRRPPRPPRYHHTTGGYNRAGQGLERHSQGQLRRRASAMLSSVGGSVRKRMGKMSGFFAKM
jgi:hypothetical protein